MYTTHFIMFLTPFGLIFASVAHFTPGQLLQGSRDEGKLTCLQVFLCVANIILFAAAVSYANSYLEIPTPSFPRAGRAGALDGGLLQLHADSSVPETLREEVLTLAERACE